MAMWVSVDGHVNGNNVQDDILNKPLGQLRERTDWLKEQLTAISGNTSFESVRITNVPLDTTTVNAPTLFDFVYLDTTQNKYSKALAEVDITDGSVMFRNSEKSYAVGLLVQLNDDGTGTVVLSGKVDLQTYYGASYDISNMLNANETFREGPYYLSYSEAGKMTAAPLSSAVYLGYFTSLTSTSSSGNYVILSPQYSDLSSKHTHHSFALSSQPAGQSVLITQEDTESAVNVVGFAPNSVKTFGRQVKTSEQDTYFLNLGAVTGLRPIDNFNTIYSTKIGLKGTTVEITRTNGDRIVGTIQPLASGMATEAGVNISAVLTEYPGIVTVGDKIVNRTNQKIGTIISITDGVVQSSISFDTVTTTTAGVTTTTTTSEVTTTTAEPITGDSFEIWQKDTEDTFAVTIEDSNGDFITLNNNEYCLLCKNRLSVSGGWNDPRVLQFSLKIGTSAGYDIGNANHKPTSFDDCYLYWEYLSTLSYKGKVKIPGYGIPMSIGASDEGVNVNSITSNMLIDSSVYWSKNALIGNRIKNITQSVDGVEVIGTIVSNDNTSLAAKDANGEYISFDTGDTYRIYLNNINNIYVVLQNIFDDSSYSELEMADTDRQWTVTVPDDIAGWSTPHYYSYFNTNVTTDNKFLFSVSNNNVVDTDSNSVALNIAYKKIFTLGYTTGSRRGINSTISVTTKYYTSASGTRVELTSSTINFVLTSSVNKVDTATTKYIYRGSGTTTLDNQFDTFKNRFNELAPTISDLRDCICVHDKISHNIIIGGYDVLSDSDDRATTEVKLVYGSGPTTETFSVVSNTDEYINSLVEEATTVPMLIFDSTYDALVENGYAEVKFNSAIILANNLIINAIKYSTEGNLAELENNVTMNDSWTVLLNIESPGSKFAYNIGFHSGLNQLYPPIPITSAAFFLGGVDQISKDLFPDVEDSIFSTGLRTIYWFSNKYKEVPWADSNYSLINEFDSPGESRQAVYYFTRMNIGNTNVVTSLKPSKENSPIRITQCGTNTVASVGDLAIDLDMALKITHGEVESPQVVKYANGLELITGNVVERLTSVDNTILLTPTISGGQGTIDLRANIEKIRTETTEYVGGFDDITLLNAKQTLVGMFSCVELLKPDTASTAFILKMRTPLDASGTYNLLYYITMVGFTAGASDSNLIKFNISHDICKDYKETTDNDKAAIYVDGRIITVSKELALDNAYTAKDPILLTNDENITSGSADVYTVPYTILPEVTAGDLLALRIDRVVPSNEAIKYMGSVGFVNMTWKLTRVISTVTTTTSA